MTDEPAGVPGPTAAVVVAPSARLVGRVALGPGAYLAPGTVVRAADRDAVAIGAGSAVLENSVVVGTPSAPVRIGARTVFGHRCLVVGATVGDLCEIGNGSIIGPGAQLGNRVFLGEGTLVPAGMHLADGAVAVGSPARVVRTATAEDVDRLAGLRGGDLSVPDPATHPPTPHPPTAGAGADMGTLYRFRDRRPSVDPSAVLFDSAELTGDITVGAGSIIGAGVRILGDSHGPVRIGAGVQILENSVLHLLPDNELVIHDGVLIGPGCMIHGCELGEGTVVEPGANVCDWVTLGAGCHVLAGSVVKQRSTFAAHTIVDGFPATAVGVSEAPPTRPGWALDLDAVASLVRVER